MKYALVFILCVLLLAGCESKEPDNTVSSASGAVSDSSSCSSEPEKQLLKKKITKNTQGDIIQTVEYEYDANGNTAIEKTYDENGAVLEVIKYEYSEDRLVREIHVDGSENVTKSIEYVYENGRISYENIDGEKKAVYTYNDKDRLAKIDYGTNQVYYVYTAEGILAQEVVGDGNDVYATTDYRYYEDGTVASVSETSADGVFTIYYKYKGDKVLDTAELCDSIGAVLQYIDYIY